MNFLLEENVSIFKNSYNLVILKVIKKDCCRIIHTALDQIYIISDKLLAEIWKDLLTKISVTEKIKYQFIKYINQ